ncbi:hypothetical protein PAMP_013074 [Pampus punctatissimus]
MLKRGCSSLPRLIVAACKQPRCCRNTHSNRETLPSTGVDRESHNRSSVRGFFCTVLHVNSLSAGATPFSTHSKLSPSATGLSKAKKRSHMSCEAAAVPRGLKSLSYCASVKDLFLCCSFETGMCFKG